MAISNPPVDTYRHDGDKVIKLIDDDECLSYAFGAEYDPIASYRVRKYKPGKDMGFADDTFEDGDADEQYNG